MQEILGLVRRCVEDYDMIQAGDTVAVGVSGGKDSLLTLTALARLSRFYPKPFRVVAMTVEAGTPGMSFDGVADYCRALGVEYIRVSVPIYEVVFLERREKNPCSLCAKLRRGALSTAMNEHGIRKIALGHHYDDAIGTVLMGLIYGGQVQAMLPRVKAKNYEGMELIRPLYFTREQSVIDWAEYCGLTFLPCDCPAKKLESDTKRAEIKQLIASLAANNPQIEANIFNAVKNVDTAKLLGWRDANGKHNFLDQFE